jgi:uncharacterized phage infection (PIP) family protein YhgE
MNIPELANGIAKLEQSLADIQSKVGGGKGAAIRAQLEEIRNNALQFKQVHEGLAQKIQAQCQEAIQKSESTIKKAQELKEAAKKAPKAPFVFPAPKKELPGEVDPELGDRLRDQLLARFGLQPKTNGIDGLDWKDWLADQD